MIVEDERDESLPHDYERSDKVPPAEASHDQHTIELT